MSTNINITVGDNALLDAAKLQQEANRQAQLNREASKRLEAQATAARIAALATQGRDANGNLITGAPFTQPQIERRPAANRLSGYPVALALGGFNTPSARQLTLWPKAKYQVISLTKTIPDIGVSYYVPANGLMGSSNGDFVTLYQRLRNFEQMALPVGKETLIYCFYSNTAIGESTVTNASVLFETFTVADGPNAVAHETYFCAVVSKNQIREITMPPLVRTAMEAQTPLMIWNPATTYGPINEFGGVGGVSGYFSHPTGFPAARDNPNLRFEIGGNSSPSIFASLGQPTPTPPAFALAACQLDGTCVFDTINGGGDPYGWDLTRNPDADVPTYQKNRAASTAYPAGLFSSFSAWDWGNPAYCRSQLLALGFSEADLTP